MTSFHRPHPFNEVRGRSYSQVSEDQYHDAVESMEGWRFLNEASLLQTWEEGMWASLIPRLFPPSHV